jgi:sodium/potassium-transporting ATPase subunit alpha
MNDYGFPPSTLFFLSNEDGFKPKDDDVYNPSDPYKGNTNAAADPTTYN